MDFETDDGWRFSVREVWEERDDEEQEPRYAYASVTAWVSGKAYAGKIEKAIDDVDDEEFLSCLAPVPPESIHPVFPATFTRAPKFDRSIHYLKSPSFLWDDCQDGKTFVADCLLNEASVLEQIRAHPHSNLATYYGCVVQDGRITDLCLKRYARSLTDWLDSYPDEIPTDEAYRFMDNIDAGIRHLHAMHLAHNDINPENICLDENGAAIIVDFDSCLPFGEVLMKGSAAPNSLQRRDVPRSHPDNDWAGLNSVARALFSRTSEGTYGR